MAFNVTLYNFSKKENSTARPSSTGRSFNCTIKKETGIINPSISLDIGLSTSPEQYNYAYIPEFDRYYWIEDWVNEQPLWTAQMKVDVLASYRPQIGSQSMYALRTSNLNQWNPYVADTVYPTLYNTETSRYNFDHPFYIKNKDDIKRGIFVLGTVSEDVSVGGLSYYIVSYNSIKKILTWLLDDSMVSGQDTPINQMNARGYSSSDATFQLQKSLIDPLSFIKSCRYFPLRFSDVNNAISGRVVPLKIGGWEPENIYAIPVTEENISEVVGNFSRLNLIPIRRHPQQDRGFYLNTNPYTKCTIKSTYFNDIDLDLSITADLENPGSLGINYIVDLISDQNILEVLINVPDSQGDLMVKVLFRQEFSLGVDIPLSQVTKGAIEIAGGAIGNWLGNLADNLPALGLKKPNAPKPVGSTADIVGKASAIASASITGTPSSVGNQGSFSKISANSFEVYYTFTLIADEDLQENGRPCCRMIPANTYSGYYLIGDADVSINATSRELQMIRSYLQGGFYYE